MRITDKSSVRLVTCCQQIHFDVRNREMENRIRSLYVFGKLTWILGCNERNEIENIAVVINESIVLVGISSFTPLQM